MSLRGAKQLRGTKSRSKLQLEIPRFTRNKLRNLQNNTILRLPGLPSATAQRLRRIGIGADHRGYKLKEKLKFFLVMQGYKVNDYGVFSEDRADYPKIAIELAHHLKTTPKPKSPKIDWGILICSTGVGMSIAANKVKGIRAALCLSPEFAQRARQHNNANVLVLAGDFTSPKKAQEIVKVFLSESFLKGRYRKRTNQIAKYEKS